MRLADGRGFGLERAGFIAADGLAAATTFAAAAAGFLIGGAVGIRRCFRVTTGGVDLVFARGCSEAGAERFEKPFGKDNFDRGGSDGGGNKPARAAGAVDDRPERSMPGSVGWGPSLSKTLRSTITLGRLEPEENT